MLTVAHRLCTMLRTEPTCSKSTREAVEMALDGERGRHIQTLQQQLNDRETTVASLTDQLHTLRRAHDVEVCKLTYDSDTRVRDACEERDRVHNATVLELTELRRVHDQLTHTMNEQLERVRIDERHRAQEEVHARVVQLQTTLDERTSQGMELERRMVTRTEEMARLQTKYLEELTEARTRISELETPMGRGRAGRWTSWRPFGVWDCRSTTPPWATARTGVPGPPGASRGRRRVQHARRHRDEERAGGTEAGPRRVRPQGARGCGQRPVRRGRMFISIALTPRWGPRWCSKCFPTTATVPSSPCPGWVPNGPRW